MHFIAVVIFSEPADGDVIDPLRILSRQRLLKVNSIFFAIDTIYTAQIVKDYIYTM